MTLSRAYAEEGREVRLLGERFELNPNCQGLFYCSLNAPFWLRPALVS